MDKYKLISVGELKYPRPAAIIKFKNEVNQYGYNYSLNDSRLVIDNVISGHFIVEFEMTFGLTLDKVFTNVEVQTIFTEEVETNFVFPYIPATGACTPKAIVLENDVKHVPPLLTNYLQENNIEFTVWFNFSNISDAVTKMKQQPSDVHYYAFPSFVGDNNSLFGWVLMLLDLKEENVPITLSILMYNGEDIGGIKEEVLANIQEMWDNSVKQANFMRMVEEVITFHTIIDLNYKEQLTKKDLYL